MEFIKKHIELFSLLLLFVICFLLFFFALGEYSLIDVDESRYISIARDMINANDYMTLRLNGEFFFEKPPLYFWLVNASFFAFNKISEFTGRFPIALLATLSIFGVYFGTKRMTSFKHALLTSLILATGIEFVILTKVAILDMVLSALTTIALIFGYLTFFVEENKRKYFWWGFYFFTAAAFMGKGIPGIVIPVGTMFFAHLLSGKLKEIFKPLNILPGVVLFLLVSIPWHYIMIKQYNHLFIDEYIIKHHLARFLNSEDLGRKQPFLFFIPVFLGGFMPWTASFIAMIVVKAKTLWKFCREYFSKLSYGFWKEKWNNLSDLNKFLFLNIIAFCWTFLFFSVSSTKLPTYILPAMFPAACFVACYWFDCIFNNKNEKSLMIATHITNGIFIIAALAALFTPYFLPADLEEEIAKFRTPVVILFFFVPMIGSIGIIVKNKLLAFLSNVAFVCGIAIISSLYIFNFVATVGGENDLIKFAIKAQENGVRLGNFNFGRKYSLNYYYDNFIDYQPDFELDWLNEFFDKNENGYIIIKIKDLKLLDEAGYKYSTLESGRRYCIITKQNPFVDEKDEVDEFLEELLN